MLETPLEDGDFVIHLETNIQNDPRKAGVFFLQKDTHRLCYWELPEIEFALQVVTSARTPAIAWDTNDPTVRRGDLYVKVVPMDRVSIFDLGLVDETSFRYFVQATTAIWPCQVYRKEDVNFSRGNPLENVENWYDSVKGFLGENSWQSHMDPEASPLCFGYNSRTKSLLSPFCDEKIMVTEGKMEAIKQKFKDFFGFAFFCWLAGVSMVEIANTGVLGTSHLNTLMLRSLSWSESRLLADGTVIPFVSLRLSDLPPSRRESEAPNGCCRISPDVPKKELAMEKQLFRKYNTEDLFLNDVMFWDFSKFYATIVYMYNPPHCCPGVLTILDKVIPARKRYNEPWITSTLKLLVNAIVGVAQSDSVGTPLYCNSFGRIVPHIGRQILERLMALVREREGISVIGCQTDSVIIRRTKTMLDVYAIMEEIMTQLRGDLQANPIYISDDYPVLQVNSDRLGYLEIGLEHHLHAFLYFNVNSWVGTTTTSALRQRGTPCRQKRYKGSEYEEPSEEFWLKLLGWFDAAVSTDPKEIIEAAESIASEITWPSDVFQKVHISHVRRALKHQDPTGCKTRPSASGSKTTYSANNTIPVSFSRRNTTRISLWKTPPGFATAASIETDDLHWKPYIRKRKTV